MCGIAGIVDLSGQARPIPTGILGRMAGAIFHRGPDEEGYVEQPGLGLVNRRLSIVGLADGRQPIRNEDGSVVTVFNGEFFDYPEMRQLLAGRGHVFRTHTDTELIPHLWEDHQEQMFDKLRGQFAVACFDQKRRRLVIGRDRFGICPLYWTRQTIGGGEWLLFASEVKALLASGLVPARPDLKGIDQMFNFIAVPGPASCFAGISILQPGHYLRVDLPPEKPAELTNHSYWHLDFPARGDEIDGDEKTLVDGLEEVLLAAVDRRLRADVPVVSYLSGGIDSSIVVAMACKIRGKPIPTFTIQVLAPNLDETTQAAVVSRHIGASPVVVPIGDREITETYVELTRAAEAPVIDTSCTGLLLLARSVHQHGYKVALTGEGSDEWLAGYPWFHINKMLGVFDRFPGMNGGGNVRRVLGRALGLPRASGDYLDRVREVLGHNSAFQDLYALVSLSRERYYSKEMKDALAGYVPYVPMDAPLARIRSWHTLNQGLYWAGRIHLAGHLLSLKGDRIAMNSSVETRYPFLDEAVFKYLAALHPRWKMRGFKEKYILRLLGERYLPYEVAWRKKGMFRAPLDSFFAHNMPAYINQLLSPESLRKAGYFDVDAVTMWADRVRQRKVPFYRRNAVEIGLVGVVATQLWHHTFIDGSLCDLPSGWQRPAAAA
jgi:asparagine synthase (glutamine-hydrolysing)